MTLLPQASRIQVSRSLSHVRGLTLTGDGRMRLPGRESHGSDRVCPRTGRTLQGDHMAHDILRPPDFLLIGTCEPEPRPGWLLEALDPGPSCTAPQPSLAARLRAWLAALPLTPARLSTGAR